MKLPVFLIALLLLASISPLPGGEMSVVELKSARKLYLGKCAKCHKLHDPNHYEQKEWDEWMVKMNKKSKLKPEQAELLARYIAAGKSGSVALPK